MNNNQITRNNNQQLLQNSRQGVQQNNYNLQQQQQPLFNQNSGQLFQQSNYQQNVQKLQRQLFQQQQPQFQQQNFYFQQQQQLQQQQFYPIRRNQVNRFQEDLAIFDDDEAIEQNKKSVQNDMEIEDQQQKEEVKKKKIDFDLMKNLNFSLKSMTKAVKLSANESQIIPAMVSITTSKKNQDEQKQQDKDKDEDKNKITDKLQNQNQNEEFDLNDRPGLDLVCVIDRSGSMGGNKIKQVQEALHCLVELLNEKDRIMLVQFDHCGQRILPFVRVCQENLGKIKNAIESLRAGGGTSIQAGMELALKGIKERKYQNEVSSIFLLSDGQDSYGCVDFLRREAALSECIYTINSFGFGADHDPKLMNQICQVQDGNFYYVEQIDTVDEMFIDALGGLFTVIAQGVNINVSLQKDHKIFSDVSVSKTYGQMWKYDEKTNSYNINILQLISGVSKEFLLEIQLPPISQKLQDFERSSQLLKARIEMYANSDHEKKNPIIKEANLEMTFYNQDENIPQEAQLMNDEVELNYLRVRGADVIQQCLQQAEQGKFEQGQQLIKKIQKDIDQARPQNRQKLEMLYNDLIESEQTCNKDRFQAEGRFKMISQNKAHMEQRSRNCQQQQMFGQQMPQQDMYQNFVQQQMCFQRAQQKQKF